MKQTTLFLLILSITSTLSAQEQVTFRNRKDGFGAGFKVSQVPNEFGIGVDLTSPSFLYNSLQIRLNGHYYFHQHYSVPDTQNIWTPYYAGRFGVVGFGGKPVPFLRMYGEGGVTFIAPDAAFSSYSLFVGGYGLFGFEFFMSSSNDEVAAYYIELGGTGSGAQADKEGGKPIFHNGFTIGTGFRFYF